MEKIKDWLIYILAAVAGIFYWLFSKKSRKAAQLYVEKVQKEQEKLVEDITKDLEKEKSDVEKAKDNFNRLLDEYKSTKH